MIFHDFPDEARYHETMHIFETSYSLDDWKRIKKGMKTFFTGYLSEKNAAPTVVRKIRTMYSSSFVPAKKKYAELLALIFISEENFSVYTGWLAAPVRQVWNDVLQTGGISSRELIVRYKIYAPGPADRQEWNAIPELCYFNSGVYCTPVPNSREKTTDYYFFLPPKIHSLAMTLYFPAEKYELTGLDSLPADEQLQVYENKQKILTDIPVIKGVEQQGYIVLNTKGNVNQSTVTTVERKIELSEFFDSVIRDVSTLRGYLLLTVYTRYRFDETQTKSPEAYIRHLFGRMLPADCGWLLPVLMHHTKGYRDLHKLDNPGGEAFSTILDYVRSLPSGKWVSVENLLLHSSFRGKSLLPLPEEYLSKDYLRFRNESIRKDDYPTLLTVPFVKSVLFLLGAFGAADLAYGPYSVSFDSYYESLRYFRPTEFGEYVLGKKESFVRIPEAAEKHYFEADDSNLIIRSLEPDNIYEKLLREMAVQISRSRFKVTPISFLRSCKTPADIENKIDFFRLFISPQPSRIWIDFFESVKKRVNPLTEVKSNFKLFKLDPENTELIRLVAQDPLIRKYVLKAENHHILIKNANIPRVVERLKTYGYLL